MPDVVCKYCGWSIAPGEKATGLAHSECEEHPGIARKILLLTAMITKLERKECKA